MQRIKVEVTSNHNGTAQRRARGMGRQRTVQLEYGQSSDWNAENAARTLWEVLGWDEKRHDIRRVSKYVWENHSLS